MWRRTVASTGLLGHDVAGATNLLLHHGVFDANDRDIFLLVGIRGHSARECSVL